MTIPLFPTPTEPTSAWLTAVLHNSGALVGGAIDSVKIRPSGAFNSRTAFLQLSYTQDSPPSAPTRMVLKRNREQGWSMAAGQEEVGFYRLVAGLADHPRILAPYYAAEFDPTSRESFLLLQDLSETHAPPISREEQISLLHGVPSPANQHAVIDTLAAFHAYWWDHPLLSAGEFESCYWSSDADRFSQYLAHRASAWQRLIGRHAGLLSKDMQLFYERLFERLPGYFSKKLYPRVNTNRNLTLIHGDTYFCNFLCPRIPETGSTYLMDWQSPSCDLAAYDLVNLLATFWSHAQRNQSSREIKLLRRYHEGLQSHHVGDFSWDDLLTDYRDGLVFWVLMPVQDAGDGADPAYWIPKMQCLVQAFEDWGCWEILSG